MINEEEFIVEVIRVAREQGYKIELSTRNGLPQIDFGKKKLHAGHLAKMYPAVLSDQIRLARLIESVAPGRPCAHRPMREIIERLRKEGRL